MIRICVHIFRNHLWRAGHRNEIIYYHCAALAYPGDISNQFLYEYYNNNVMLCFCFFYVSRIICLTTRKNKYRANSRADIARRVVNIKINFHIFFFDETNRKSQKTTLTLLKYLNEMYQIQYVIQMYLHCKSNSYRKWKQTKIRKTIFLKIFWTYIFLTKSLYIV